MRYEDAVKLHNEDEVAIKETGEILPVVEVEVNETEVRIMTDDGNWHRHDEVS